MWPLVTYSNYFKIFSTVIFLLSRTGLDLGMFLINTNTVSLYTIINDYTSYKSCSAWFLDIVISTCYIEIDFVRNVCVSVCPPPRL